MTTQDKKFWTNYFKVYDALNDFIPYQELVQSVVEAADPHPGEKILDAGCGTGNVAIKLTQKGADVVGVDNVPAALERYVAKDPTAKTVQADLCEPLPFANEEFDKIVCVNTLYTLDQTQQKKLISEFHRVVKKGGVVVVSDIKSGWSPNVLYIEGLKKHIKQEGIVGAIKTSLKLVYPTVKILMLNRKISKDRMYHNMILQELITLMESQGFTISNRGLTYSGMDIIVKGERVK